MKEIERPNLCRWCGLEITVGIGGSWEGPDGEYPCAKRPRSNGPIGHMSMGPVDLPPIHSDSASIEEWLSS